MYKQNFIEEKNEQPKKLPEKKFKIGAISATIWANEVTTKDGKKAVYKTISFERRYKDKNDEWQKTTSLRVNDLPKANLVLSKAYEYINLNEDSSSFEGVSI